MMNEVRTEDNICSIDDTGLSNSMELHKVASDSVKNIISQSLKIVEAGKGNTDVDIGNAETVTLLSDTDTPMHNDNANQEKMPHYNVHSSSIEGNKSPVALGVHDMEEHMSNQSGSVRDRLKRMSQLLKTSRKGVSSLSAPYLPADRSITLPEKSHPKCSIEIDDGEEDVPMFDYPNRTRVGLVDKQKPVNVHLARLRKMGGCLADSIWRCIGGSAEEEETAPSDRSKEPRLEFTNLLTVDDIKTDRGRPTLT